MAWPTGLPMGSVSFGSAVVMQSGVELPMRVTVDVVLADNAPSKVLVHRPSGSPLPGVTTLFTSSDDQSNKHTLALPLCDTNQMGYGNGTTLVVDSAHPYTHMYRVIIEYLSPAKDQTYTALTTTKTFVLTASDPTGDLDDMVVIPGSQDQFGIGVQIPNLWGQQVSEAQAAAVAALSALNNGDARYQRRTPIPLGAPVNLNTVVTSGRYDHGYNADNQNAPVLDGGFLDVQVHASGLVSQRWESAAGRTFTRRRNAAQVWQPWVEESMLTHTTTTTVDVHPQYLLKNALPIADGVNLDTLTAPGNFVRATSIGSTPALNYPTSEWAGFVEVLANENRSFVVQRATFYSNSVATPVPRVRVWTRSRIGTSAAFGPWLLDDAAPWIITGRPENVVAAPVGTIAVDKNATNGAVQWIKVSGAGATGWKVTHGDTGWRTLPLPDNLTMADTAAPYYQIRRINETVHFRIRVKAAGALLGTPRSSVFTLMTVPSSPAGFLSSNYVAHGIVSIGTTFLGIVHTQSALPNLQVAAVGQTGVWGNTNGEIISASFSYLTDTDWPQTLPGEPAT